MNQYSKGASAYKQGKMLGENPHDEYRQANDWKRWREGWVSTMLADG